MLFGGQLVQQQLKKLSLMTVKIMMKKVHIADFRSNEFISKVAEQLNLKPEQEERIFSAHLLDEVGHGYFKAFDFDNGITVYEIDCTLKKDLHIIFETSDVQPLFILFNREETIFRQFEDSKKNQPINHLESVMVSANLQNPGAFIIPGGQSSCFFACLIDRKAFEEKIEAFIAEMPKDLVPIFRDLNGVNSYYTKGYFSLDIAKFIEEYTTTELEGFMRHVFLEGKIYEIITHYLKQFLDDTKDPSSRTILRQNTVDKIEEASNIIQNELEVLGSIMSLAKRVGLNQNTLQEGFKQLYKKSVNQYIKDSRLEKAKELMETTDLNITEITYQIGINSRSYFSKLFKDKYGMCPKDYIQKARKSLRSKSA